MKAELKLLLGSAAFGLLSFGPSAGAFAAAKVVRAEPRLQAPLTRTEAESRRLGDAARIVMEGQQRRWDRKMKALSGSICIGC